MESPKDKATKAKLQLLLYQLGETLKDPPIMLDVIYWKDTVEETMKQIKMSSELAYNRLEDLVDEAVRRAEAHVIDLDNEDTGQELGRTSHEYFEQVAFVTSEINSLKSI